MVEVLKGVHAIDFSEGGGMGMELWLLNCPEGTVLVDTGMRDYAIEKIETELKSIGKGWRDVEKILITHRHGDHVANLKRVQELTGAEVMSHKDEADAVAEKGVEVTSLEHGQILPYCGGIEVIHVPGHSDGNAGYYLPAVKAILAGDIIFADDEGKMEAPPERYCKDVDQARREINRFLDYDFDALLLTHGKDTMNGAKEKVRALCGK
ncbi:MAG: MBL fold metallo-hydrolase [Candidatus Bathyarchaeota archaeon]|nr:MAG: MBL fold metallo-hydrolase [Candidatus Bathyarchaeota archaeon]